MGISFHFFSSFLRMFKGIEINTKHSRFYACFLSLALKKEEAFVNGMIFFIANTMKLRKKYTWH